METKYETEKKEVQIATFESKKRLIIRLSIVRGTALLSASRVVLDGEIQECTRPTHDPHDVTALVAYW